MLIHLIDFIARTHLVVLHFPIALITIAAMVESSRFAYFKLTRRSIADNFRPSPSASTMLVFGFLFTIVALITGLIFGFDYTNAVNLHRILGIVTTVLVLITIIALKIAHDKSTSKTSLAYLILLCISALAVSATGHFGGSLTHGEGFLTDPLKQIFNPPPTTQESIPQSSEQLDSQLETHNISPAALETYTAIIQPILENSCTKCHGQKKQKGDIRLDTLTHLLDPDFAILERGDPNASEIVYRLHLDPDDEDAMPPEGKADPLTTEQIQAIHSWIASLAQ